MPGRVLALLLAVVLTAAGLTIWLASLLPASGVALLVPLALLAVLGLRLLQRRQ
ncbi:hypothetical protein [Rhodovulum sulfidophilum]|uniref:Uncharacterized protein n=1 Tax=Rhodovulum sulfidophilum TaxID=35806 RepID=A0A0D6B4E8_RHOSU|nr:hypothetical protein [Rhodovulum sulfidophilum]MBL3553393.1 hypothetical protein [Rhodovulum sulfidophilum]MBL3584332.1 hypothetical protein [Rhodovulum sulfidophilum]MCE8456937.1 hypothetical protein [Rhodovulum sulfidophilum]NDK34801.1 hypothetical protein [Rhodovulum sulfidophilum]BAQ69670.1 hypothetical protein NHU_02519 [Rhodovulum sulfidophilum]